MLWLVKLQFKKGLNFNSSEESEGEDFKGIIHSDTLFGALVNQMVQIPLPADRNSFVNQMVAQLNSESPPFKISSAFPFLGSRYYLPVPIGTSTLYQTSLKGINFIELADFVELAKGNFEYINENVISDKVSDILFNFVTPRVTIDRLTASTNYYQSSGWTVEDGGGFYFLLDVCDEIFLDRLKMALNLLSDSGLGGDRSLGFGQFEFEMKSVAEDSSIGQLFEDRTATPVQYYSLSLCHPSNLTEKRAAQSYHIIPRRGWFFSTSSVIQMKRRECKMFYEGSLFTQSVKGNVATVTPSEFLGEHQIYRYGLAMTIEMVAENYVENR